MELLAATDQGLWRWEDGRGSFEGRGEIDGEEIAVTTFLSRAGDTEVAVQGDKVLISYPSVGSTGSRLLHLEGGLRVNCALALAGNGALVGTSEAHLYLARATGGLELVQAFEKAEGRERWHTPWGGPPDVRSLSSGVDGAIYANVHVGGILRSDDGGATWAPTAIPIEEDVHQVLAHPDRPGLVLAASAYGLARSEDGGATWETIDEGLERGYCRAVAAAGDTVLLSASSGPGGGQAALYRLEGERFEKCDLPDPFGGNLDTHRLVAQGAVVAAALPNGDLSLSKDAGEAWEMIAQGLPAVRCLSLETS